MISQVCVFPLPAKRSVSWGQGGSRINTSSVDDAMHAIEPSFVRLDLFYAGGLLIRDYLSHARL